MDEESLRKDHWKGKHGDSWEASGRHPGGWRKLRDTLDASWRQLEATGRHFGGSIIFSSNVLYQNETVARHVRHITGEGGTGRHL